MRYVGRHRAQRHRAATARRAASFLTAVVSTAALVAVPSAASALDTTPTVQLVMSHVRFASFVGTPEVAEISGTAFDTSISAQKPTEGARDDNDEGGGRVPLTRSHPRNEYSDAHFDHAAQFGYSTSTYQWSTRLSSTLQSRATSPVTERTYWYINNGRASGSGHVQAPNYTFHGSFAARPGDAIDMANEFVFECGPNATCVATLYSSYYVVS